MGLVNADGRNASGSERTAADIYSNLRELILTFELFPGTRMTENELARHFLVSRTPVREALQKLEMEGYIDILPKQGCFVRNLDIEALSQYYRVRIALEMQAVDDACAHMPTRELEKLLAEWDPTTHIANEDAPKTLGEKDERFHLALAQGGGNRVLAAYLKDVNNHIRIIRRLDLADNRRVERTYTEHFDILQTLLQRDAARARRLIKRHIERSEQFAKTLTLTELARRKAFAKGLQPKAADGAP